MKAMICQVLCAIWCAVSIIVSQMDGSFFVAAFANIIAGGWLCLSILYRNEP